MLSGCAAPVIQRADSTFEATGLGLNKEFAQRRAIKGAQNQCGKDRTPIILKDSYKYNGIVQTAENRLIETGMVIAGAALSKNNFYTPGLSRNDDHEYTIVFKCQ